MLRGARRIDPVPAAADGAAAATSTAVPPPASDAEAPEEAAAGGSRDNATRASKGSWRSLGGGQQAQAAAADDSNPQDGAGPASDVVVLDVRNGYEWDAGHFQGAVRPFEVSGTLISLCQRCVRKGHQDHSATTLGVEKEGRSVCRVWTFGSDANAD